MLDQALRMLGVDLQRQTARLEARVEGLAERLSEKVTARAKETSLTIGLALAGAIAAGATVVVGLIALYTWVAQLNGPTTGFAVVAAVTALIAAICFAVAFTHNKQKPAPIAPRAVVPPAPPPSPRAAGLGITARPAEPPVIVAPLAANASLLDVLAHRVTTRAAAASEDVIEAAEETLRTGSRPMLFGTLGMAVLLGIMVGRRRTGR